MFHGIITRLNVKPYNHKIYHEIVNLKQSFTKKLNKLRNQNVDKQKNHEIKERNYGNKNIKNNHK